MKQKPKILNTTPITQSRLFHVEGVDLEFSNGVKRQYERLRRPHEGAVMTVPITNDNQFIMIREYAVGIEDYELTFPKGFIDPAEEVLTAANRELQEEIGFGAKAITVLKKLNSNAAYMRSQMHICVAKDLFPASAEGDEPEPLELVHWPIANYKELLQHPEFISAMSFVALFLVSEALEL